MDALVIVVLVMSLSILVSSNKRIELGYHNAKLAYEESEKLRIEEIKGLERCRIEKGSF